MGPGVELRRDWYFTPGTEWIFWDDPRTGKLKAFRVILSAQNAFLEWSEEQGFSGGSSDEGDRPGRSKMSPTLTVQPGAERTLAPLVLALVNDVRANPPTIEGTKIQLPKAALQSMVELLEHVTRDLA